MQDDELDEAFAQTALILKETPGQTAQRRAEYVALAKRWRETPTAEDRKREAYFAAWDRLCDMGAAPQGFNADAYRVICNMPGGAPRGIVLRRLIDMEPRRTDGKRDTRDQQARRAVAWLVNQGHIYVSPADDLLWVTAEGGLPDDETE